MSDLELEDGRPKKVFLRETIDKEVRLSYLERIQRTLPEEYFAVFPEKADIEEWKPISGISTIT
jgi:nuclear cap-binding protein subunit 1